MRLKRLYLAVLPPIPTAGLTIADVGALASRVHDMMVEALREISVPVPRSGTIEKPSISNTVPAPEQVQEDAQQDPLTHVLPAVTQSGPDVAAPASRSESRASEFTSASEDFSSSPSSRHGYEGSETGVETEEDEGMVLVGRPQL